MTPEGAIVDTAQKTEEKKITMRPMLDMMREVTQDREIYHQPHQGKEHKAAEQSAQEKLHIAQRTFSVFGVAAGKQDLVPANPLEKEIAFREKEATYQKSKDRDQEKDAKARTKGPVKDVPEQELDSVLQDIETELAQFKGKNKTVLSHDDEATASYLSKFQTAALDLRKTQKKKGRWFGNYSSHIALAAEKYEFYRENRARIIGMEKARLLMADRPAFEKQQQEKKDYLIRAGAIKGCIVRAGDRTEEAKAFSDLYSLTTKTEEARDLSENPDVALGDIDKFQEVRDSLAHMGTVIDGIYGKKATDSAGKEKSIREIVEEAVKAPMFDLLSETGKAAPGQKNVEDLGKSDREVVMKASAEYRECCMKALELRSHIEALVAANMKRNGKTSDPELDAYIASLRTELGIWEFHASANRLCVSALLGREKVDRESGDMYAQYGYIKDHYGVALFTAEDLVEQGDVIDQNTALDHMAAKHKISRLEVMARYGSSAAVEQAYIAETGQQRQADLNDEQTKKALAALEKAGMTGYGIQSEAEKKMYQDAYNVDGVVKEARRDPDAEDETALKERITMALILTKPLPRFETSEQDGKTVRGKLALEGTKQSPYGLWYELAPYVDAFQDAMDGSGTIYSNRQYIMAELRMLRDADADLLDFARGEFTGDIFKAKDHAGVFDNVAGMPSFERKAQMARDMASGLLRRGDDLLRVLEDPQNLRKLSGGEPITPSQFIRELIQTRDRCERMLRFVQDRRQIMEAGYDATMEEWARDTVAVGDFRAGGLEQGPLRKEDRLFLDDAERREQPYQKAWEEDLRELNVPKEAIRAMSLGKYMNLEGTDLEKAVIRDLFSDIGPTNQVEGIPDTEAAVEMAGLEARIAELSASLKEEASEADRSSMEKELAGLTERRDKLLSNRVFAEFYKKKRKLSVERLVPAIKGWQAWEKNKAMWKLTDEESAALDIERMRKLPLEEMDARIRSVFTKKAKALRQEAMSAKDHAEEMARLQHEKEMKAIQSEMSGYDAEIEKINVRIQEAEEAGKTLEKEEMDLGVRDYNVTYAERMKESDREKLSAEIEKERAEAQRKVEELKARVAELKAEKEKIEGAKKEAKARYDELAPAVAEYERQMEEIDKAEKEAIESTVKSAHVMAGSQYVLEISVDSARKEREERIRAYSRFLGL